MNISPAPHFELSEEAMIQKAVAKMISRKLILSAHDVSEGGLFTTLLESGMKNNLGFEISTDANLRKDAFLFGEAQSRVVVSVNPTIQAVFEAETSGYTIREARYGKRRREYPYRRRRLGLYGRLEKCLRYRDRKNVIIIPILRSCSRFFYEPAVLF
ncbi:MAG: AIR synthase-related protein [Chitinophagaceae bacterium]